MKPLLLLFAAMLLCSPVFADDFAYGNFSLEQLNMTSYTKDKSAHAVVLQEYGKTWISSRDGLPQIHEYHVKIKIFDSKAFNKGDIQIPIYKSDDRSFEQVKDIEGVTFYTDEQGNVKRAYLDPKKVITENKNKYWDIVKFAMPNLRDGCVIEYKYTLESPYTLQFKNWKFQSDIPKVYSEYEARIPGFFNFKASLRGPYKLTTSTAVIDRECFDTHGSKADCSKLVYGIADVPAFIEEDDMTSPKNFISSLDFELNDWVNPFDGSKHVISQTWDDIDRSLKQNEEFGSQLRKTGAFKDKLPAITAGLTTELDKAKAIYTYMQKNIKCNNFIGIYTDNGIRKALDTHSGSVADINLGLVVALNAAGINTEAVLLSTRDHGFINKLYPVKSDFNYVIAKANIDGKSYLLDATESMLPFGMLPEHCINDQGRVMSLNKPSYWIDMKASHKRANTYAIDLTLQPSGKLTGTIKHYSSGYSALAKRRAIKKFNSIDEFVEDYDAKMPKLKILKANIANLDSLDLPLSETYEVEVNAYDGLDAGKMSFNPYLFNKITENPYKLSERNYPVDRGTQTDSKVIFTMHLPDGYTVETPPQNISLGLPNQGGRFITNYEPVANSFTFSHILQLNNPIYLPEEYPYLKEFYSKAIQAEKLDIVFAKK